MTQKAIDELERFLEANSKRFTSFDRLSFDRLKGLSPVDRLFRDLYFLLRRLKSPKK